MERVLHSHGTTVSGSSAAQHAQSSRVHKLQITLPICGNWSMFFARVRLHNTQEDLHKSCRIKLSATIVKLELNQRGLSHMNGSASFCSLRAGALSSRQCPAVQYCTILIVGQAFHDFLHKRAEAASVGVRRSPRDLAGLAGLHA